MSYYSIPESKRSYRHLIDGGYFVDEAGINNAEEQIHSRYEAAFLDIQELLKKYGLIEYCTVNPDVLWRAILDFFEDVARLKHFHGHRDLLPDKEYAYEVFWILRDHPIQIVNDDEMPECYIHVNEYILTKWLIKKMATELESRFIINIQVDRFIEKLEEHDLIIDFSKKLYYTFRHRTYTAQSLLIMIEGFMNAAEFTLQIT